MIYSAWGATGMAQTHKDRALKILQKMTLAEKIGQMSMRSFDAMDEQGVPQCDSIEKKIAEGEVGFIIQPCHDYSSTLYELQKIAVEKSRLGIPLLFNTDCIHGAETVFPIPLALACSFNPELAEETAKASAREIASWGVHYTNAPMVDIARDPRWGRICESQGEDTYLAEEMGKAYVRGFQNDERYVMATLKHYAGYGACEGGRDYDVVEVCENTMRNVYLPPFRAGVEAGADSVMTAFNCIENVPATGNKKYVKDILRGEFGFDGIVLSDAVAVWEMLRHGYCKTERDCAQKALHASLDVEMGTFCYENELEGLVAKCPDLEKQIDEAVLRILLKKFQLGLFDNPYKYFDYDKGAVYCAQHLDLSERSALQSAVLLENDGVLPLSGKEKIAFVGALADSTDMCGAWQDSTREHESISLKRGMEEAGFVVVGESATYDEEKAVALAKLADVVVFTAGEASRYESGEARSKHSLELSEDCKRCFARLLEEGTKVVTIVFAGRPLVINPLVQSNALVYAWHLGQRAGRALSKLLKGQENFSAKLSVTIPRTVGQIPTYYNRKNVGRPFLPENQEYAFQTRYFDGENYPQYPFGYGLSYSKFDYSTPVIDKPLLRRGERASVSLEITNTGAVDGVEIVQLYIRDECAEAVRPIRELKGFQRVSLRAGERKTVCFTIEEKALAYYHIDGKRYADDGEFTMYVGKDSTAQQSVKLIYEN